MPDVLTPEQRYRCMSAILAKDTRPELTVRRIIHSLGYRYRLHNSTLPGKPDLVFPGRRKVIFVHGCFWHRHSCRKGRSVPSTRQAFWAKKLQDNQTRGQRQVRDLRRLGWGAFVVWQCQLSQSRLPRLIERIVEYLE
jgi:DNA mismatch endonuclease (patch repair protein)